MRAPSAPFPAAPCAGGLGVEIGGAFGDPADEPRDPWMGAQGLHRVVAACKLGLGQRGVDLVVADLVQKHRGPALAAAQARDQVVQALLRVGRDGALAERADGIVLHG